MSNRLYVGNLSYNVTSEALRNCFAEYGEVTDTHLVLDRESGRPRGFAFVTMMSDAEATHAVAQLNNAVFEGRALRVNIAEERAVQGRNAGSSYGNRKAW